MNSYYYIITRSDKIGINANSKKIYNNLVLANVYYNDVLEKNSYAVLVKVNIDGTETVLKEKNKLKNSSFGMEQDIRDLSNNF